MVDRRRVEAHPALVVVYNKDYDRVILARYDETYRDGKGPYHNKVNLIGGNPNYNKFGDNGPLEVLIRELGEEFDPLFQINNSNTNKFGQEVDWANKEDIEMIRDEILNDLRPFKDFYVSATSFGEGTADYTAIYSVFQSLVSDKVFKCADSNLKRDKTLVTEGLTALRYLDNLVNDSDGKLGTAHATAPILNKYFTINIPYPDDNIIVEALENPRNSFQDYCKDFDYSKEQKPNHNKPRNMDPSCHNLVFGSED